MKIVLGSASPRRKTIFERLDADFLVFPVNIDEERFFIGESVEEKVLNVSREKLNALKKHFQKEDVLLITADTVVVASNKILGKPLSYEDAFLMLEELSGKWHTVITGVSVKYNGDTISFFEKTEIKFMELSADMINAYLKTKEYEGKAGSYAIQGKGGFFIERIEGDYYNVVGFPMNMFLKRVKKYFGIDLMLGN